MSLVFLDTSALMKLYIPKVGSNWLRSYITNNQVGISELALYESATVLRRRFLDASITQAQALALYAQLQYDSTGFKILELRINNQLGRVINLAFSLLGNLRIRALDGIQLAAAQVMQEAANLAVPPVPFIFVSADLQLLRVAQAQGFATENPENHP